MSITEIVSMYGMKGGNENIYKLRSEIEMGDAENVCCMHINLLTLKWLLFVWRKNNVNQNLRGGK